MTVVNQYYFITFAGNKNYANFSDDGDDTAARSMPSICFNIIILFFNNKYYFITYHYIIVVFNKKKIIIFPNRFELIEWKGEGGKRREGKKRHY